MSHTFSSTPTLHSLGAIAGRIAEAARPRDRGPDRQVRRGCIDEKEAAAQPWAKNQFGSSAERIATSESLIVIAKDLFVENEKEFPWGAVKRLTERRAALSAELAHLMRLPAAEWPVGLPASLRIEIDRIEAALKKHSLGITRTDVIVYEAIWKFLCFAGSGRWFPSLEKIAIAAGCCEKTVSRALPRLDHHGLLSWISRSAIKPSSSDPAKRQRVQTSHAYFLDLKKRMVDRLYQRFLQLRERRHRRMTRRQVDVAASPPVPPTPPAVAPSADVLGLRQSLASLDSALGASDGHPVRV